jgi:hypothetical protein
MTKGVDIEKLIRLSILLDLLILLQLRLLSGSNCLQFDSVKNTALKLGLILRFELDVVTEFVQNV